MDDVRIQEVRAAAAPQSNIANMLAWMRRHPGPILTSRIPEPNAYPGLVAFPLEPVINALGYAEMVDCEHRSRPDGTRSSASLNSGSMRRPVASLPSS